MSAKPFRALILALTLGACAGSPDEPATSAASPADVLLQTVLERDGGPGVMAAVMRDGELVWSGAAGYADLEARVPLTTDTRMRIGSVSKTFTAVLALRLAERGALDLDGDIRTHVPELRAPERGAITPALIAAHLSGIRQYNFQNYLEANNVMFLAAGPSEALSRYVGDPLLSQPGEAHHYTSLGFNILGVAEERATGASYGELLAREITGPLGLSNTMIDHPLEIIERRTRFYTRFPDGVVRNTIWRDSSDYYPSGGVLSSAEDLVRFASAVFAGEYLNAASLQRLTTEQRNAAGEGVGYTFGWQVSRDAQGRLFYEHGGETNGAYATVRYYPEQRLAISGIVNANWMGGRAYFFEAVRNELPALYLDR
ncbi:MAG TPA: serine hydrolase domain-containing protein [Vitreimonas sp.]|uniref:serine hydrolase domain-containing protein n=1 Tax=Vitreimonas sp. TaxID=3069702 RepID=UPI002D428010|nr:serine hydrolase domain-containing protein [Vitreimonas sp.]HYD89530.1 serine hydrolase domain-containing protein [Vitreimonas sp.]